MKKLIFCIVSLLVLCACLSNQKKVSFPAKDTAFLLNTIATFTIYDGKNIEDPQTLIQDSFSLCSEYEKKFSRTIQGSEIAQINQSQGNPVTVSHETASLIRSALEYSEKSQGAFDITIAPASILWDFQNPNATPPEETLLAETMTHVGYDKIHLDGNQITLLDPNVSIDLGGIAKGYIADRAADFLKENGVTSGVLNLGGNIYTIGQKPDGLPFRIGIQKPFAEQEKILGFVSVANQSIVTSGIYERFFRYNEELYHHILNPKTGFPVENDLLSVTIISNDSMNGDALSTTCFVLGLEKGLELIENTNDVEAIFVCRDNSLHFSSGIGTIVPFEEQ